MATPLGLARLLTSVVLPPEVVYSPIVPVVAWSVLYIMLIAKPVNVLARKPMAVRTRRERMVAILRRKWCVEKKDDPLSLGNAPGRGHLSPWAQVPLGLLSIMDIGHFLNMKSLCLCMNSIPYFFAN